MIKSTLSNIRIKRKTSSKRLSINRAYKLLGLSASANIKDVDQAFHTAAKICHPDRRGGDKTQFLTIKKAYNLIRNKLECKSKSEFNGVNPPSDHNDLKSGYIYYHSLNDPDRKNKSRHIIDVNKFNKTFQDTRKEAVIYTHRNDDPDIGIGGGGVYDVGNEGSDERINRTKADMERELSKIDQNSENIQCIFKSGQFDHHTFNRAFEHYKQIHKENNGEIEEFREPESDVYGTSLSLAEIGDNENQCSDCVGNKTGNSLIYSKYKDAYNMHDNPQSIPGKKLARLGRIKRNDAEICPIDTRIIRERMDKYRYEQDTFERNNDKLPPSSGPITHNDEPLVINSGSTKPDMKCYQTSYPQQQSYSQPSQQQPYSQPNQQQPYSQPNQQQSCQPLYMAANANNILSPLTDQINVQTIAQKQFLVHHNKKRVPTRSHKRGNKNEIDNMKNTIKNQNRLIRKLLMKQ